MFCCIYRLVKIWAIQKRDLRFIYPVIKWQISSCSFLNLHCDCDQQDEAQYATKTDIWLHLRCLINYYQSRCWFCCVIESNLLLWRIFGFPLLQFQLSQGYNKKAAHSIRAVKNVPAQLKPALRYSGITLRAWCMRLPFSHAAPPPFSTSRALSLSLLAKRI
jgi:hypothetical protein